MYCPSFFNCQPKQAETLAQKGHIRKNANRLADYMFCCLEKQSEHCFSCCQLAVERQQQRRRKCPLIGHTNNRPSLLSVIEDFAKFGHSYSSVADRRLQSSAMQSPIGAYGLVLRCRRSAPSVLKGLKVLAFTFIVHTLLVLHTVKEIENTPTNIQTHTHTHTYTHTYTHTSRIQDVKREKQGVCCWNFILGKVLPYEKNMNKILA